MDYASLRFREDQTRQHLAYLIDPDHCTELRILKAQFNAGSQINASETYHRTIGGWYNHVGSLACDVARVKGVSVFAVVNPVKSLLLPRSPNRLTYIDKGKGTCKTDIVCYRWVFVDIDAIRSTSSDDSATEAERQHAIDTRAKLLADYPAIAASSIYGTSGNGAWILIRVPDYPADDAHQSIVGRTLARFAREYSNGFVKIDTATKDPSRIMSVAGTVKCKGPNTDARPWRHTSIDSPPGYAPVPFDLIGWLGVEDVEETPVLEPGSRPRHTNPFDRPAHNLTFRAASYLKEMGPAISGKHGHDHTFNAACSLVKGFNFSIAEAFPYLLAWNPICQPPWTEADLWRKLNQADAAPDLDPDGNPRERGYLIGETGWKASPPSAPVQFAADPSTPTPEYEPRPPRSYTTPHDIARNIIDDYYAHAEGLKVRYWNDDIYLWDGYSYRLIRKGEVEAKINRLIELQFKEEYDAKLIEHTLSSDDKKKGDGPKLKCVTGNVVRDVLAALKSIVLLELSQYPSQPMWLCSPHGPGEETGPTQWKPSEILPTRSGLIHLPSLVRKQDFFSPLTPRFFGRYCLSYSFDPDAATPHRWLEFLEQLWENDRQAKELLQEWMGYLLTPDTSMQKIGMLIGPPRSGKGTIARVITALMGSENVVNPTLASLSEHFGSSSLLGKQVAIVTDARISGRNDTPAIVEKLLSISGEDSQTIHRKYKDEVTTRLDTRFMIISNELPNLRDSSGAFSSRMLILELTKSFLHKEDTNLMSHLLSELPGILRWAIDGWFRLRINNRFTIPNSSHEIIQEYEELSSPITRFIRENCEVGPGHSVDCSFLYRRWCEWCESNGIDHPGDNQKFGVSLKAAVPRIEKGRNRDPKKNGTRLPNYRGIRLLTDAERNGVTETEYAANSQFEV